MHVETVLIYYMNLLTCNQPTNQPTNQQNPEVEKLLHTMQNLSCLCELINSAVHRDQQNAEFSLTITGCSRWFFTAVYKKAYDWLREPLPHD